MNTNQKKLKLIGHGLRPSTLENLTESQVNLLFGKLVESKKDTKESVTKTSTTTTFDTEVDADRKAAQDLMSKKGVRMSIDPATKKLTVVSEKDETVEGEVDEKFESKKQQKYFFSKCGDGKTKEQKKWCKMADEFSKKTNFAKLPEKKKETKEGYLDMVQNAHTKVMSNKIGQVQPNPKFVSELENRITKLVEKHITPKMSKKDFLSLLDEGSEVAPAKPKTKPTTKPGTDSPYKPKPGVKPAPKAKKEIGEQSPEIAPARPTVKPGTKPKKPGSPYSPKPGPKPAPKAIKKNLPSWLSFNEIGIKLKG
jgi:hypothetical protein